MHAYSNFYFINETMNGLKCRTLGVRLCTNAGKARAVRMLVLPHAVTAGALLFIEQEYLIVGKPE